MIVNVFLNTCTLEFGDARGHNIERENYLKDLRKIVINGRGKSNNETDIHLKVTPKDRTRRDYRERSISPKPVSNFDRQSSRYCDTDWRRSSENWRSSWSSSYYERSRDSEYWRRRYQYYDRYGQRSYHSAVGDPNWRRRDYHDHHHYGYDSQCQPPHQRRDHHCYESDPRYGHDHQQDRSLYRDFFDTKPNREGEINSFNCILFMAIFHFYFKISAQGQRLPGDMNTAIGAHRVDRLPLEHKVDCISK